MREITIHLADGEFSRLVSLAAEREMTVDNFAALCLKIGYIGVGMVEEQK